MIISVNARRAAVLVDEPSAVFDRVTTRRHEIAGVAPSAPQARPTRATVEVLWQLGGLMPRALVGGELTPGADARLVIEVGTSGVSVSGDPTCESRLARRLAPGLPDEFASAVTDGLIRRALPGGRVSVDRAAFDALESSPVAFELAAEILAVVLGAGACGDDVESAARATVAAWP